METVEAIALVSGRVEEELLLRNEYLAAENEILKSKLNKQTKQKSWIKSKFMTICRGL